MYKLWKHGVQRIADGSYIPDNETLPAWREYLQWLAEGNTPEPEQTPEEIAAEVAREQVIAQKLLDISTNLPSRAAVMEAIDNATTLAALRAIVKKMAGVLYWLAKDAQD